MEALNDYDKRIEGANREVEVIGASIINHDKWIAERWENLNYTLTERQKQYDIKNNQIDGDIPFLKSN